MALKDRFKRWILRAALLVLSGTAVVTALLQSAQEEGLTCADAQKIVNFLDAHDSPYTQPFVDKVIPNACSITYTPRCSRLADGTICRMGLAYGPGRGGTICPEDPNIGDPCVADTCDVSEGTPVPCRVADGMQDGSIYDPADIDAKAFLFQLARKLRDEGFAESITDQ